MSDPTARTLALLALLQTHRFWPGPELAERLGVSVRTVRRDVDRLRELGYQVDATIGVDGGYQLAPGATLPPLLVDEDEAVALAVGLQAAANSAIEGIEETTVRLLAKLDRILPDRLRRRVGALRTGTDVLRWTPSVTVPAATLTVLAQACRDSEEVRFDYTRRDGEASSRLVRPFQLVAVGYRWYLVAYDVRRADWRTFRLDRMVGPALAGVRFEPLELPADSAAEFVAASLRSMREQHEATVVLVGDREEIEPFSRWFRGSLDVRPDGTVAVTLSADSLDWLAGMVATLAASFELTVEAAPDELRSRLAAAADRLARQTGGGQLGSDPN